MNFFVQLLWFVWPGAVVLATAPRAPALAGVAEIIWLAGIFSTWIAAQLELSRSSKELEDVGEEFGETDLR